MIYFLLPAFNEEENIRALVGNIRSAFAVNNISIILVNDGSSDRTEEIAENLKKDIIITILNHKINMGLGQALKTGFNYLTETVGPSDIVVTMDTDNSHPPDTVKMMIEKINNGAELVVASRFVAGGAEIGVNIYRKLMSRVINRLLELLFYNRNVRDYTSGFRVFKGSLLLRHKGKNLITETGFTATAEILLRCIMSGAVISEVPLILRYDRKRGTSKIKIFRTIYRYFILILKLKYGKILRIKNHENIQK